MQKRFFSVLDDYSMNRCGKLKKCYKNIESEQILFFFGEKDGCLKLVELMQGKWGGYRLSRICNSISLILVNDSMMAAFSASCTKLVFRASFAPFKVKPLTLVR